MAGCIVLGLRGVYRASDFLHGPRASGLVHTHSIRSRGPRALSPLCTKTNNKKTQKKTPIQNPQKHHYCVHPLTSRAHLFLLFDNLLSLSARSLAPMAIHLIRPSFPLCSSGSAKKLFHLAAYFGGGKVHIVRGGSGGKAGGTGGMLNTRSGGGFARLAWLGFLVEPGGFGWILLEVVGRQGRSN